MSLTLTLTLTLTLALTLTLTLTLTRYVGPALHQGGSTVLLGDAIHTVKPYFGLGVNSALEDVLALRAALG